VVIPGDGGRDNPAVGGRVRTQRGSASADGAGNGGRGGGGVGGGYGGAAGSVDTQGFAITSERSFAAGVDGGTCPTLTIDGVGDGGTLLVDGQPPGRVVSFVATGLTPGATAQLSGSSNRGDSYGPFSGTVGADGKFTVSGRFWVSEDQVDTWVVADNTGRTTTSRVNVQRR
jgi:hypothetical protein